MEPVIVMSAAVEYNAATERVNTALQTLKNDLISLRHQDVRLLKQLIHINETIRTLSKDKASTKNRLRHCGHSNTKLSASFNGQTSTTPCSKWQTQLIRQQSVPRYCNIVPEEKATTRTSEASTSSGEESSLEESFTSVTSSFSDMEDSMSASVPVFSSSVFNRQRSQSVKVPMVTDIKRDDSNYEEILRRNVKLWKVGQMSHPEDSEDSSVFTEEEEEDSEGESINE